MKNIVNRALVAKKKQFQSKSVPRGTRTIWRYLGALFILFTFAIGNVWAAASSVIPSTPNYKDISAAVTENVYTFECLAASITEEANATSSWIGWYSTQSSFKIYDKSGSANCMGSQKQIANLKYDKVYFYVTKCDSFQIQAWANGSDRTLNYSYQPAGGSLTEGSFTEASNTDCAHSAFIPLDKTKNYTICVWNNNGEEIAVTYMVFKTAASSGPVDPTATFSNSDYTIGGTLDLSTLFTSNSEGAVTYTITDAGDTGASLDSDGKTFSATAVGTATVKASQAATSAHKAVEKTATITVKAAVTPVCPSGVTISGTAAYTAGETIELTAALSEGNGEITYNWYKGADLATAKAAGSIGTGASFSKASCAAGDAGNYFCVATKATCSDAESAAYAVTVAAAIDPWIIKVALSGDISSATKTMSGSIGGDAAYSGLQNSSAPYKIGGNSAYLNLTLSTGYFYPGDSVVLDLSKTGQIFYGATDNDNDHLLGTTTTKDGIHYFILPASFPANTNSIHVGRTSSTYNGTLSYMAVYRTPICPQTLTISGETDYVPGDKIELTASLAKGNGAITYQWYKGGTANENKLIGKTNAKLEIEDCVAGDAGDYYCIASKEDCSDAVNAAAYTITVNDFVAVTGITISPASPTVAAKSKITLTAEVAPAEATNKVLAWSVKSGSEAYASVNATTGEVTGKAEGNAVIVATATDGSGVFAEKTVVVTPFVCPTSGTMFSLACTASASAKAAKNGGVLDCDDYGTVVNGVAQIVNNSSSDQESVTSSGEFKLTGITHYMKIELDCELAEGDSIILDNSAKFIILKAPISQASDTAGVDYLYYSGSSVHKAVCGEAWDGVDEIYISYIGSSLKFKNVSIIRPAKYAVTFNMHGHGDAVDPQTILKGGKVTEPATTSITGWDFGGWYKTYVADPESYSEAWDFENDVVSDDIELHAKWTAHVASNDVALGTLSVNGEAITIVPSQLVYAVELPFGTTAVPAVTATANDANAKACNVTQALAVDGSATIYVKAEDNTTEATYTINFSVATSKAIQLVFKTGTTPCVGSASTSTQILSNNAAVSTYINQITFTNVEGAGDDGAEGGSLNVGKKAGNMFTLSAKPGYAFQAMNFLAKIQDATCEYSIDGGAWTELASTNTGGDECYAPFTSGTVHEFRLRSTGTSGVWIRNMQLTIVEACTPIVVAWDEEPVEFEVGKAGYAIAATANNGGTITYASADNTIIDVNASTGALTIADLGSVALSASTPEGDGSTYCANGGDPIVLSKAVNTYYLVSFDAQNGDAADEVKYYSGDAAIALPAAPTYAGYDFQGWFNAETGGTQYTAAITPTASATVYAQWVAQCDGATITTQPTGASYLTGRTPAALVCEATAGAGGALTYEWFTCDDEYKANPVAATATPSTAVAGTFYYFCKVMEEGCDVEAYSDVVTITVADKDPIYLAWVDVTGQNAASLDASKSLYAPEVSASGIKNSSSYDTKTGYKFNSDPAYIAIEGAPFKSGDIVEMFVTTTTADKARVFNANEAVAANVVAEGAANMVQGANKVALTADANNLYLRRGDDFGGWNPYVAYVAVYRVCAPILNKVTVNGVEGKPNALKEVVFEVAASTTQSQLEAIAFDWVSNDDAWTAAHAPVAANAWEFGVANTVTFTDKDGDQSVYTITVNKAVPSSDATLSALSASAGVLSPTFDPAVLNYTVALPYGTSNVPTLSATKNFVGAADPVIVDAATFTNRQAVSTVTVTAEDGITKLTYTVTFQVERFPSIVIWDGSTMSAVAESPDATTGFAWTVTGFSSVTNYSATCGEKAYTKCLPSNGGASASRNIALNVPEGYLAKFYIVFGTHSDGNKRGMFIGTTATKTLDESSVLTLYSSSRTNLTAGMSELVFGAGTWYINPMESVDFYEISATLIPIDYKRDVTEGRYGTICLPNGGVMVGAEIFEIAYYGETSKKVFLDNIPSGEMVAGRPYIFLPKEGATQLAVFYTDEDNAPAGSHNGLIGFIGASADAYFYIPDGEGNYILQNNLYREVLAGGQARILSNRAYIKLSAINPSEPALAPGRRRVAMGVQSEQVATGCENLNVSDKPVKMIIDGQLFILRGEKMYDAKGQLVK